MTIGLTSLQKITELKNRLTQQANWEYAESMNLLANEQSKLHDLKQTHDQMVQELHDKTTVAMSVQELHHWSNFLHVHSEQIEQQRQVILAQEQECETKQLALTDCFLEEQKWTRFQERRRLEQQAETLKVWQEVLDELAVTGYQRKRG